MPEDIIPMPMEEGPYREPKSLIEAISDIQQYAVMESQGQVQIPESFLTINRRLHYMSIGFKYGFGDSVIIWVISPFMYAVLFNMLPIFGHQHLSLFDKAFALILSKYISVILLSLMIYLLTQVRGSLTGGCTSALVNGYTTALGIRAVVFLLAYRWLYSVWPVIVDYVGSWGEEFLYSARSLAPRWGDTPYPYWLEKIGVKLTAFAQWLTSLRSIILITSNYETVFTVAMILILVFTRQWFMFWSKKTKNPYYERFLKSSVD